MTTAIAALTALIALAAMPARAQDGGSAAPAAAPDAQAQPAAAAAPAPQPPATAQPPAPQPQDADEQQRQQGGLFGGNFLFIMAAMFAIIYFVMIRPEQRKQKERQKMLAALKKGDKVVTIGGIVGIVSAVKDSTYHIKSGEGTVIEVSKSAVSSLINDAVDAPVAEAPGGKEAK
jgi:preprotein translocase subunit YajC